VDGDTRFDTHGLMSCTASRRRAIAGSPRRSAKRFTNLSERKLMDCLNRLGYDIEIKVWPAAEPVGHLTAGLSVLALLRQQPKNVAPTKPPEQTDPNVRNNIGASMQLELVSTATATFLADLSDRQMQRVVGAHELQAAH